MKKFKFTLDTVHKVREIRQEKESVMLGKLRTEEEKATLRLDEIESKRREAIENYTRRITSGEQIDPTEMELNSNHFASLNMVKKSAELTLEQTRQACLRQIETLTEAMREVKITGNLRAAQLERHHLEYARQEQNTVDELVSATFARRLLQTK